MMMKKQTLAILLLTAVLALPTIAFGQNVNVVNPPDRPVLVKPVGGGTGSPVIGAAHENNAQLTTSTTAATLVIARPTRTTCLVRNLDAAITVYIGGATVTSANGMPIKAGESVVISAVTLWQVIAASGTPTVAILDEYN